MKKEFLLKLISLICTIAVLSLLWEFVVEGFFSLDGAEDVYEKIGDVFTTIIITLLALAYPSYKGLSLISDWKELEKTLIDQGIDLGQGDTDKKIGLDSLKSILMEELNRRKKAKEKLVSERQKFFNMLDCLPVCFHLQGNDYTVPFANKLFRERFGPPEKALCYQVMHKRSEPCEPCSTFKVFDSGKTESSIWTALDGRTYLTVVTPFEDTDGSAVLMEMAIDITKEQKVKDELRRTLDEREKHIKERTLELSRSNNALKEFSTIAAHDLKEPLRKIMLFSDRFQNVFDVEPDSKGQQYLDGLGRSVQRMYVLIEDLLELSSVPSQDTNFLKVNLNKILDEVIEDLELTYPGARENISVQHLPVLEADKTQMYQLFKNLLSNSLKYAKAEETPRISVEVELNGDQDYQIAIKDNGIGFDEKYKRKIFQPFERLHGMSQYSGTGIGLSICKKVVESHQGALDVQSQVNVGSTFTIHLPKTHNR